MDTEHDIPALRDKLARCTEVLPSEQQHLAARDLWIVQDALRMQLDPQVRPLPEHHGRQRVTHELARYTPAQLLAALDGAAMEAKERGDLQYFNGVSNWRPDSIDRHIARAQASQTTVTGARALFEELYRAVDPRWWTALPANERSQTLDGLVRAFGDVPEDTLAAALRRLADTATRAPSRADIRAAISARRALEAPADELPGGKVDPALTESAEVVAEALTGGRAEVEAIVCDDCGQQGEIVPSIALALRSMRERVLCGRCTTWKLNPSGIAHAIISKIPRHPRGPGRRPTLDDIERCERHGFGRQIHEALRRAGWGSARDEAA